MSELPPLVEPAEELTRDELARYARHLSLPHVGLEGQRRLKNARVLIIGAGGLGSPALHYLAAAGVGTLGVVDDDVVSVSNLQRQVVHGMPDVDRPKTASAREAVERINPLVAVCEHPVRLSAENAAQLLADYDLVLDGADNFATRYLVSDAAELAGIPVVWGSILRFDGQVSVFWSGRGPTYRDLYPEPPAPGEVPSCAEGGVVGSLPATIGSVMVTEAIKLITGLGRTLLGRVLCHDALAQTWRELTLGVDPSRKPVTSVQELALACAAQPPPGSDAPAAEEAVSARRMREMLTAREAGGMDFALVDVREDWEREISSIPGSIAVPMQQLLDSGRAALPPEALGKELVLHCQSGQRSGRVLAALRPDYTAREESVRHLDGGIEGWEALDGPPGDHTAMSHLARHPGERT